jgi:hypothetical protein
VAHIRDRAVAQIIFAVRFYANPTVPGVDIRPVRSTAVARCFVIVPGVRGAACAIAQ